MAGLGHRQDRGVMLPPLDEIDGFMVRPGFYNSEGAVPTARGVSFTIHSVGATDRKSTRLNSSHVKRSRMPSSA